MILYRSQGFNNIKFTVKNLQEFYDFKDILKKLLRLPLILHFLRLKK